MTIIDSDDLDQSGDINSRGDLMSALLGGDDDSSQARGGDPSGEGFGDTLASRGKDLNIDDTLGDDEPKGALETGKQPQAKADPEPEVDENAVFFDDFSKSFGIDLRSKYNSVDDALKGLAEAYKLVGKHNDEAAWGRRLIEEPEAVYRALHGKFGQQQQAASQQQQQQPAQQAKQQNSPPEWDDTWLMHLDEKGNPKPGADPNVIAQIKKYNDYAQSRGRDLLREGLTKSEFENQIKQAMESLKGDLLKQIQEGQQQTLAQQQQYEQIRNEAQSLINEEASWAYVDGDPRKGPSREGQVFKKYLDQAGRVDSRTGLPVITDLRTQKEWAKMKTIEELSSSQQQAPAARRGSPSPAAVRRPNVSPQTPAVDPEAPWQKGTRLEDELLRLIGD